MNLAVNRFIDGYFTGRIRNCNFRGRRKNHFFLRKFCIVTANHAPFVKVLRKIVNKFDFTFLDGIVDEAENYQ